MGSIRISVDEAGRGCWAGPVLGYVPQIHEWALAAAYGHATPQEVDRLGIVPACGLAARRAIHRLAALGIDMDDVDHILLDGDYNYITPRDDGTLFQSTWTLPRVETMIKADLHDKACSAASVIAKVRHDHVMLALHADNPNYLWDHNLGYPTKDQAAAVEEHGLTRHHRKTWATPGRAKEKKAYKPGNLKRASISPTGNIWPDTIEEPLW